MSRFNLSELATLLRRSRVAEGMTLADVAQLCEVSVAAVSSWETGNAMPSAKAVPLVATALRIDPMKIATLIVEAKNPKKPAVSFAVAEAEYRRAVAAIAAAKRAWAAAKEAQ